MRVRHRSCSGSAEVQIDPLFGRCAPPCLGKTHTTVRDSGDAMMAGSRIFITAVTGAAIVCKLTSPELRCQEAVLRIGRTGRNPMTVITILQMPADASRISALRHPAVSSICRGLYRACPITPCSPIGALRQPGKTGPSPSAGLGGRFGEQPDHPQVLDGLIWAFRTFRVFWSGWYSEPVVVLSGFDGWPVIKGPLYRAGTTPPSIRRSVPKSIFRSIMRLRQLYFILDNVVHI